jgi:coenzyme F420-reducing hydrogenase delta subunit
MRCAGNLHTSVIELLLRGGATGVLVATCPGRDCWGREGPTWLAERVYRGREAELRESLDRRRLRIVAINEAERRLFERELSAFREDLARQDAVQAEEEIALDVACDPPAMEAGS